MRNQDHEAMRQALLLEEAINRQLDALVKRATQTMLILGMSTSMEESQLRNLLNVAQKMRSVEVVTNFIRYQIGRKERDWGVRRDDFGHTIIRDLDSEVSNLATAAIQEIKHQLTEIANRSVDSVKKQRIEQQVQNEKVAQIQENLAQNLRAADDLYREAHIRLAQLYLGYLGRAFYFFKKMQEKSAREKDPTYQQEALALLQQAIKKEVANA